MDAKPRSAWLIPGAIIVAGLILAVAVFVLRVSTASIPGGGDVEQIMPIALTDHIRGNPEAAVVIVEYADIDSEHSKAFHAVMEQLMADYAASGKVAWVYRHFPLTMEHPNSLRHAIASECAAAQGGPESFWRFIDLVNAAAPGADQFDPKGYGTVVRQLGLNETTFTECTTKGSYTDKIRAQTHNALASGAEASPFTVVLVEGQDPISINGALTYDRMKEVVNRALAQVP